MGFDLVSAIRPQALRAITWAYSQFYFGRYPRSGLRVLMYHAIGTPVEDDTRCLYNMTPAQFGEHMRHLAQCHTNRLVPLDLSALEGDSPRIALTFDDGYRDNLVVAAPLLAELGIPFTIFICTGAVAELKAGFLTPRDVRELAALPGVRIGSHTISHPRLTECDDHRLNEELVGSKRYLEDLLGSEVDLFSYPHGAVNSRVRNEVEEAGYRIGASSRFGINHSVPDPLLLYRTDIWANDDVSMFKKKLRGDLDWIRWRSSGPGLEP
jgi:peptidoglycan/xylan/chitin deacetylase (PgdA/CDA1 family)